MSAPQDDARDAEIRALRAEVADHKATIEILDAEANRQTSAIMAANAQIARLRGEVESLTRHNRELWDERKAAEARAKLHRR